MRGLPHTNDTAVPPSVKLDENGMFVSVDGAYRVKEVLVQDGDGKYAPLDLRVTYTLASHNYMLKDCGDGFNMFSDNELVIDEGMLNYQILITYIANHINEEFGALYARTEGRIAVQQKEK